MIKKLLIKLLGNDIYQPEPLEMKKMQDWLYKSFENDGYRNYYTMRKKYLMNLLALGLEGKEQSETLGRLKELKALFNNIRDEFNRRKTNS